jgi:hypothetical protein
MIESTTYVPSKVIYKTVYKDLLRPPIWLYARLEKALGVSEAVNIRLVPRHCLGMA